MLRHKTLGLKGVTFNPNRPVRPWRARIYADKRTKHLGCYKTEVEAHEAWLMARGEIDRRREADMLERMKEHVEEHIRYLEVAGELKTEAECPALEG